MLQEANATIAEARVNVNPDDYDIVFWDACREDNSLLFSRLKNLIKSGKVVILTGTNSCAWYPGPRKSTEIANDLLRDFGMELTMDDDPRNLVATSTGKHAIMNGVSSFLTFRSAFIKIADESNVVPLATNGENILLPAYIR
jgi:hypothetical protein